MFHNNHYVQSAIRRFHGGEVRVRVGCPAHGFVLFARIDEILQANSKTVLHVSNLRHRRNGDGGFQTLGRTVLRFDLGQVGRITECGDTLAFAPGRDVRVVFWTKESVA